jgi:hypothetical protein
MQQFASSHANRQNRNRSVGSAAMAFFAAIAVTRRNGHDASG